jgi:nitrile hydratase accessory protein
VTTPIHPALVSGPAAPPRRNGELVFAAPWEGRTFAMAVAMVERLGLDWSEFQERLIAAIAAEPDRAYYASWVAALEALLVDHGVVSAGELAAACGRVDAG